MNPLLLVDSYKVHHQKEGLLTTVFKDGILTKQTTLEEIRERIKNSL